jgi:hypothetical protein
MPAPTYSQLMEASESTLETWMESADNDTATKATTHKTYRSALTTYADDVLEKAAFGPGSNPPGNPPPPPNP